jgi:hypothetical protein
LIQQKTTMMKIQNSATPTRAWLLIALFLLPTSAFAYVDPGSGMLIWQGLLALLGAAIMFVRNPIETIKRLLSRFKRK